MNIKFVAILEILATYLFMPLLGLALRSKGIVQ
jgi:hypothetical protein